MWQHDGKMPSDVPAGALLQGRKVRAQMKAQGRIDRLGCLVSADPPLARLHAGAGGVPGGKVAIPQIATIARLAHSLSVPVSWPVLVADGPQTIELMVDARPDSDGVGLAISGWNSIAPVPVNGSAADREHDFARLEADGAWETDASLRLLRMSAAIDGDLGVSATATRGLPLSRVFRLLPDDQGDLPILSALANRAPFFDQRAEVVDSDHHPIFLSGEPVYDDSGRFSGLRGRVRLLAAKRDTAEPDIQSAYPPDEGFARRLDAALRGPIGRIIHNADAAAAQVDGPVRRGYAGYANDIASAARHLLGLVDDLANLQTVERADFTIETDIVDLADIARRAAGLLGVRAADRKVRIDRPGEDEQLPAIGDFGRVLQIMVNLVGNAVRYSPEGSAVWIRSEAEGDIAVIVVADQGKGISSEDQERIFEKFERVDQNEPGGSGLGLYISRRLARAMGGDITVDSAPGQGARFTLTLRRPPEGIGGS